MLVADQRHGIQELVAQGNIEEAFESVVDPGGSAPDDAVEHRVFASAAVQAQEYPGYFVLMASTCFRCHSPRHSQHHLYK